MNPEDLRKVHGEVLQLVNQRFQVVTLAMLVFVTICGWLTSAVVGSSSNAVDRVRLARGASLLLLTVLLFLFLYQFALQRMLRTLTTYLKVQGSVWEDHWQKFRKTKRGRKYWAYSKGAALVFSVLGIATLIYPLLLQVIFLKNQPIFDSAFLWVLGGAVIQIGVTLTLTAKRHALLKEDVLERDWCLAIGITKGDELMKSNSEISDRKFNFLQNRLDWLDQEITRYRDFEWKATSFQAAFFVALLYLLLDDRKRHLLQMFKPLLACTIIIYGTIGCIQLLYIHKRLNARRNVKNDLLTSLGEPAEKKITWLFGLVEGWGAMFPFVFVLSLAFLAMMTVLILFRG